LKESARREDLNVNTVAVPTIGRFSFDRLNGFEGTSYLNDE